MESNAATNAQFLEKPLAKAHASMCNELEKIITAVTQLIPDIESARPGWKSGIQELCSLNNSVEKGRLLIQHCAETSKLYSVITRDATISRCERVQTAIKKSLIHIQCMVPDPLATQIANILDFLMDVKFVIDVNEEEAGNALLSLLRLSDAKEDLEFKAFEIATRRLDLSSSKALLIERRCIKKLFEKYRGSDKKEKILRYLLHLIKKHGKNLNVTREYKEYANDVNKISLSSTSSSEINSNEQLDKPKEVKLQHEYFRNECEGNLYPQDVPPEEYICPISSKLMYDPVIIASGQTYERIAIETWFKEGNNTCPKTQMKLSNLCMIPNSSMRNLISHWCQERSIPVQNPCLQPISASASTPDILNSGSMSSVHNISAALLYGEAAKYIYQSEYSNVSVASSDVSFCSNLSNMKGSKKSTNASSQMFLWSDDYTKFQSFADFGYDLYLKFLSDLSELPLPLHNKALEDVKHLFSSGDDHSHSMLCNGFTEAIIDFLKVVCDSSNLRAQKTGLQILLAVLSNFSYKIPSVRDDAAQLLTFILKSGLTLEALMLIRILCRYSESKSIILTSDICSSIMDILRCGDPEHMGLTVEILSELSSIAGIKSLILSSDCLSKLVQVLRDEQHAVDCLRILADLCNNEEGAEAVAKADGCIPNIAELLDSENLDAQADAAAILLSLCSRSHDNCSLVMNEGVIPALVDISVNGNARGKEDSVKLLHILRDRTRNDQIDNAATPVNVINDLPPCPSNQPMEKKEKKPASKRPGFLVKITMLFSKPKS